MILHSCRPTCLPHLRDHSGSSLGWHESTAHVSPHLSPRAGCLGPTWFYTHVGPLVSHTWSPTVGCQGSDMSLHSCRPTCLPHWESRGTLVPHTHGCLGTAWVRDTCLPPVSHTCKLIQLIEPRVKDLGPTWFYTHVGPLVTSHCGCLGPTWVLHLVFHLSPTLVSDCWVTSGPTWVYTHVFHLSPTLERPLWGCLGPHDFTLVNPVVSHTCLPLWDMSGSAWVYTGAPTLVSHTCLPHLSPTLVSHTHVCHSGFREWAAWGLHL